MFTSPSITFAQSIHFYTELFAAKPIVAKSDYAKWMLDDPRVNFAISRRGDGASGIDHLGIQVETPSELREVYERLQQADRPVLEEGETTCCYAKSEKSWITDPQGVSWETFLTSGESTIYGDSVDLGPIRTASRGAGKRRTRLLCAQGGAAVRESGHAERMPVAAGPMGMTITIYHNPACGTSRNVLGLIRNSGEEPHVIEYLKTPPSREELVSLIARMGMPVRDSVAPERDTIRRTGPRRSDTRAMTN